MPDLKMAKKTSASSPAPTSGAKAKRANSRARTPKRASTPRSGAKRTGGAQATSGTKSVKKRTPAKPLTMTERLQNFVNSKAGKSSAGAKGSAAVGSDVWLAKKKLTMRIFMGLVILTAGIWFYTHYGHMFTFKFLKLKKNAIDAYVDANPIGAPLAYTILMTLVSPHRGSCSKFLR